MYNALLGSSSELRASGQRLIAGSLAAVVALFLLDALVFRFSGYPSLLEPDSSTGMFELFLWNELHRKAEGPHQILTVGDSRMGGFLPRAANESSAGSGYQFASVAVSGTTPRCWYYLLRDVDPTARRYSAIVVQLGDPAYEDPAEDYPNRIYDLRFVIARLRLGDVPDFARSFPSAEHEWQAWRGGIFKGIVYQRDLRDFLWNPRARLAKVDRDRRESAGWFYNYPGDNHTLRGLSIDWAAKKITFPDGLDPATRNRLTSALLRPATTPTARHATYLETWLGRILDRYRESNTRFIFIRFPRSPIPRPENPAAQGNPLGQLASRRHVIVCDPHTFETLERPEFFADEFHLNKEGATRFSKMLAAEVQKQLARRNAD